VLRGTFRADLFYRLSVLSVEVPALRERRGDILGLWRHFVAAAAQRDRRAPPTTSNAVERLLLRHDWPGNIRELHNAAEHALTVSLGDRLLPADLPAYLVRADVPASAGRPGLVGLTLREIERQAILDTLDATGSVKAAADMLGISERKLHYRLKEYREDAANGAPRLRQPPVVEEGEERQRRARVLLAEDDDELRWALSDFLKGEGYEVVPVANGGALLTHLGAAFLLEQRDSPPDLIISDVRMPGISGLQILQSVRARAWQIPVVLMSAFGDADTRARALGLGVTAFLDKPLDLDRLRDLLRATAPRA
jgi:DNA-binding NtrC family response regulator